MWLTFFPALFVIALLGADLLAALWIPFFLLGAFVIRSAGCIINDIADHKFDAKIARTSARPIASGSIRITETLPLLGIFLLIGFSLTFLLGAEAIILGVATMLGTAIYPFAKRYFYYPQIVLAAVFNTGALFASIAVSGAIHGTAFFVYIACFFWTLYYDTIYAHQDKLGDKELGLHSISLTGFGSKTWLKKYSRIALSFLAFAGVLPSLNLLYYCCLAGLFFMEEKFTESLDLDDPQSCWNAFNSMKMVGLFIFCIILLGRV